MGSPPAAESGPSSRRASRAASRAAPVRSPRNARWDNAAGSLPVRRSSRRARRSSATLLQGLLRFRRYLLPVAELFGVLLVAVRSGGRREARGGNEIEIVLQRLAFPRQLRALGGAPHGEPHALEYVLDLGLRRTH